MPNQFDFDLAFSGNNHFPLVTLLMCCGDVSAAKWKT
jgi:hypothetical protein